MSSNLNSRRKSQDPHVLIIQILARVGNVRASRERAQQDHTRADIAILRERESNPIDLDSSKDAIGDMAPSTIAKVQKLVPLKVPYAELRPYRQELIELHLDFLIWDWNCVSETILNFYRGMGLLTKEEEKRFPKELEMLANESSEETEDEDDVQPEEPSRRTARGSVQARPKKKANRGRVVSDSLDSNVSKTDAPASTTDEEKREEPTLWMRSMDSEEVPELKTSEEIVKDLTLSEEILEQVVVQVEVIVVDIHEIPSSPLEEEEQEDHLRAKEMECEVLWLNLAKETEMRESLEQDCISLQASNVNVKKVAATKTDQVELRGRIVELTDAHSKELQRADELTARMAYVLRKHAVELADWAKKLADCESARSSEVECKTLKWLKLDSLERRLMSLMTSGSAGHK
ncbi:hypothetical protein AXG93_3548s1000 [Marchantia polymorpha subsp. ruderalis]|uniref:Uncharacterized protein n=1 Tax=Marchantia polymorpha subsp. ruderalis TaxID=1480154 RepID=A0A176VFH9_MARPO|nr:hypothetical protein AXG93_3548s1000 [Marchantia polymorpha subsp. ruderalis]